MQKNKDLTGRHLQDLFTSGSQKKVLAAAGGISITNNLLGARQETARYAQIPMIWKIGRTRGRAGERERVSPTPLHEQQAIETLMKTARQSGIEKIAFYDGEKLLASKEGILVPKSAYPALVLWYRSSHHEEGDWKVDSNFQGDYERSLQAFFSFQQGGKAWVKKADKERIARAAFVIGVLGGGENFLASYPIVDSMRLIDTAQPLEAHVDAIQAHAVWAIDNIIQFYNGSTL